jgi:hypothetical protein
MPNDPTATDRYFIDYDDGIHPHTTMIRTASDVPLSDVQDFWNALVESLGSVLIATTLTGVRFAAAGDHFSVPVSASGFTSSWGSGTSTKRYSAQYFSFIGRGVVDGTRVRLYVFGCKLNQTDDGDFRMPQGENAAVDGVIELLNGPDFSPVTITAAVPLWYPYANSGFNAYWQRKGR